MTEVRKTIQAWEQEYGIVILDLDGFDTDDPQLYDRLFSRSEFETALASCTVIQRRRAKDGAKAADGEPPAEAPTGANGVNIPNGAGFSQPFVASAAAPVSATAPQSEAATLSAATPAPASVAADRTDPADRTHAPIPPADEPSPRKRRRADPNRQAAQPWQASAASAQRGLKSAWRRRSVRRLLILFTMPTLATLCVRALYRLLGRFVRIAWYWPLLVILIDLFIILLAPVAPIVSGPLYLWYVILNALVHILGWLARAAMALTPWKSAFANLGTQPFLNGVVLSGNRLPLYFTMGAAVASSIVLGTGIGSIAELWQATRRAMQRSHPGAADPTDPSSPDAS
ncbi:hypothetical protein JI721_04070 [Alicyclobacillus cycloheptanicus]|uniref:Uncharacterized protein n=1 Tax=Alicyclobacillus cycloheptanicus TaxID=1457 RepID=A0ABT9XLI4_9BACL|nr:hypothetical protein [Alicyclobacillus cycloheptanicus]MDQ0191166.1 hypothetical protein [Alicyclobacillus cycloheptanicus]WDM02014.1 hypothetical protein JI721_04070 [Alicyclobacillus cycloheptanicus]